jgi:alanine racemase
MDYALLDVTDIRGVQRGDPVTLIGAQGDAYISADEVAAWLGTINYEVVTTLLPRVPREVSGW